MTWKRVKNKLYKGQFTFSESMHYNAGMQKAYRPDGVIGGGKDARHAEMTHHRCYIITFQSEYLWRP